jgi:anti-anti-sigma factor
MKISTSAVEHDAVLVEIEGEVDAYTAQKLEEALSGLLAQGCGRLVLDVSQMPFMSSAGLRVLLAAHREAIGLGGEVRLFGLRDHVRRVFELAGFHETFYLSDGRREATQEW